MVSTPLKNMSASVGMMTDWNQPLTNNSQLLSSINHEKKPVTNYSPFLKATYISELIWKSVDIPNIWKVKKNHVPNHQSVSEFSTKYGFWNGTGPPMDRSFSFGNRPSRKGNRSHLARMGLSEHLRNTWRLPSGNDHNSLLLKMAIEIVDLPIKHGDFP